MRRVSPGDVAAEEHDDRGDEHDGQVKVPGLLRHSHLPQLHCNQVPNKTKYEVTQTRHLSSSPHSKITSHPPPRDVFLL